MPQATAWRRKHLINWSLNATSLAMVRYSLALDMVAATAQPGTDHCRHCGQLGDSAAWQHGCVYHLAGRQRPETLDLLRINGDIGRVDRRLSDILSGAKRRQRSHGNTPGKKRAQKVYRAFERWGVGAVAIPALLPPPFPIVPSLLAAGALQFPPRRFLAALAVGRGIRFAIIAGLGAVYGTAIVNFFSRYYRPTLFILIGLALLASLLALVEYYRRRSPSKNNRQPGTQPKAA